MAEQSYIAPVRGAVAQHVAASAERNPQSYMARASIYGPLSLRRFGPRRAAVESVGGTLRGLGDYLDANDARAQGLDAASLAVKDDAGNTYYLDAGGNPLAYTDAAGKTTSVPLASSAGASPDWSTLLLVALGALCLAELS